MIKTIRICDSCGKELIEASEIYHIDFRTSKFLDYAGDISYNLERIDLCKKCVHKAVQSLENISKSNYSKGLLTTKKHEVSSNCPSESISNSTQIINSVQKGELPEIPEVDNQDVWGFKEET